jgi:hypothetical protein
MKILRLIICILLLILLWFCDAFAEDQRLQINLVIPNSMHSDHANQCHPNCATQDNGGVGIVVEYQMLDKHFYPGLFWIDFINSYGDKGSVSGIQLDKSEYENDFFHLSVSIWLMRLSGYKDSNGNDKIERPPPWPKFQIGVNVGNFFDQKIFLNYNLIYFPTVKIGWFSIGKSWTF